MRPLKMLWFTGFALAAAMAFASTAFATTATSPVGTLYTGTLKGASEGHMTMHAPNGISVSCNAALEGTIESHGTSVTGIGKGSKWEYIECTNGDKAHSRTFGTMEVHTISKGVGTITSSGTTAEVTDNTGVTCSYLTTNTDLGIVTDSSLTGGKATIHINAKIPRHAGSVLCGSTGTLTGTAVVNSPEKIFID